MKVRFEVVKLETGLKYLNDGEGKTRQAVVYTVYFRPDATDPSFIFGNVLSIGTEETPEYTIGDKVVLEISRVKE